MIPYYQDKSCTIYHGDCREILPTLDKADLVLTDPPYGISITKSDRLSVSKGRGSEKWDNSPPTREEINLVLKAGNKIIIWGGNYFDLPTCRGFLIWDKKNDGRDFGECEFAWTNLKTVSRIHRQRPQNMDGGKKHTTQKPLSLFFWCVHLAGNEIQTIIDPYMGSGTTLRVGKDLGKKTISIEIKEKYCEIAAKRLEQESLFSV